jgi:hypothetical protein
LLEPGEGGVLGVVGLGLALGVADGRADAGGLAGGVAGAEGPGLVGAGEALALAAASRQICAWVRRVVTMRRASRSPAAAMSASTRSRW